METKDAFYLIWSPSGKTAPKHRHAIRNDAEDEAARMARLHPGQEFYVMCAKTMRKVEDVKRIDFEESDIPF